MTEHKPFVITIVGAESSGKTTLAKGLAEHFGCPWVPEYAREYLEALGRPYDERDLEIMAERQLEEIMKVVSRESSVVSGVSSAHFAPNPLKGTLDLPPIEIEGLKSSIVNRQSSIVIVDGGMMNMRMWAKIKYNISIPIVEEALKNDVTDLYLLCRPHKEWTPDPLREAPLLIERVWIYNQYLEELVRGNYSFEIIMREENEKLERAILKITHYIEQHQMNIKE